MSFTGLQRVQAVGEQAQALRRELAVGAARAADDVVGDHGFDALAVDVQLAGQLRGAEQALLLAGQRGKHQRGLEGLGAARHGAGQLHDGRRAGGVVVGARCLALLVHDVGVAAVVMAADDDQASRVAPRQRGHHVHELGGARDAPADRLQMAAHAHLQRGAGRAGPPLGLDDVQHALGFEASCGISIPLRRHQGMNRNSRIGQIRARRHKVTVGDFAAQRLPHRALHELLAALNAQGLALDTLSMGMSADLDAAVAEGATIVRVGSAIFGARG